MEVPGKVRRQQERNSITYLASFPTLGGIIHAQMGSVFFGRAQERGTRLLQVFICSPSIGSQFEDYSITDGQLTTLAITA